MICGAFLAQAGYRVLLLERRNTVGGAVCTEEMFGGFKMDVGGSLHFMIRATPIVEKLELHRYGLDYIPVDPVMSAPSEAGPTITFYRDLDKTCESIAAVSPHDAEAYRRFILRLQPLNRAVFDLFLRVPTTSRLFNRFVGRRLHEHFDSRLDLIRHSLKSYGRIISDTFENEQLRAALTWWAAQSGPPPGDACSSGFIGWQPLLHEISPARPRGGSGMLTVALRRYIEAHGGTVMLSTDVDRIIVRGGRAVGVRTGRGEDYFGRAIVSNAHVWITFLRLLRHWTPEPLRGRVRRIAVGNGFGMVLRCAVHALPRYIGASRDILHGLQLLCPTRQYLNDAYADFLRGVPSRRPAAVAMTFSAIDDSLAPKDKHTLFVWGQYYPYRLRGRQSWKQIEQQEARRLLEVVDRFAPGTSQQLIDMYVQTPWEIARKHALPRANVMHVEMLPDQMFLLRPLPELSRYSSPLKGLFLASASMHPGGGIFGAAGINCSRVVRSYLRRAGSKPLMAF